MKLITYAAALLLFVNSGLAQSMDRDTARIRLSKEQVSLAFEIMRKGGEIDELVNRLGPPLIVLADPPLLGPAYHIDGGMICFSIVGFDGERLVLSESKLIASILFLPQVGDVNMPPIYVYPLEFRGLIATGRGHTIVAEPKEPKIEN